MRVWVLGLVVIAGASAGMAAQSGDQLFTATRLQLDVTKVVIAQEAAWNKGDINAYIAFYKDADDTVAMISGPVRGMKNIGAALRLNYPNAASMGKLEQSSVAVRALGEDFALATGEYDLMRPRKNGGEVKGTFTEVMEKGPGGWKVIFSETI